MAARHKMKKASGGIAVASGNPYVLKEAEEKKRDEELTLAREQHRKRTLRAVIPLPVW